MLDRALLISERVFDLMISVEISLFERQETLAERRLSSLLLGAESAPLKERSDDAARYAPDDVIEELTELK